MATITKSIGTTARDYSTITLWEAALGGAAGGSGNDAIGECYNDSTFDEAVVVNDNTPDSVKLSVVSGERHDGTAGTGARNVISANARTLVISVVDSVTVEWLEWDCADFINSLSTSPWISVLAGDDNTVSNMIVHGGRGNNGVAAVGASGTTNDLAVLNNIIYEFNTYGNGQSAYGIRNIASVNSAFIYNNTVFDITQTIGAGSSTGVYNDDNVADRKIKNNIAMDAASTSGTAKDFDFSGTTVDADYNLSSDDTADDGGGSNDLINKSATTQFVSIVSGSEDLHLKSGADAIGAGTDLGTTPTGVNIDIDGRDRDSEGDTWDIGAHQFVSVGGVTINATLGAVVIAGFDPTIAAGTIISATKGSVVIDGKNPTVLQGINIDATKGDISIAGLNPSISIGTGISATKGEVAVAGLNPVVDIGVLIQPNVGVLTIEGKDPAISVSTNISATKGAITIEGLNPTIDLGVTIEPNTGLVIIEGLNPVISAGTEINATKGAVDISGLNPVVEQGIQINPNTGVVTIEGLNPIITAAVLISPDTGEVIISGLNPLITVGGDPIVSQKRIYPIAEENRTYPIENENRVYPII